MKSLKSLLFMGPCFLEATKPLLPSTSAPPSSQAPRTQGIFSGLQTPSGPYIPLLSNFHFLYGLQPSWLLMMTVILLAKCPCQHSSDLGPQEPQPGSERTWALGFNPRSVTYFVKLKNCLISPNFSPYICTRGMLAN